MARTVSLVLGSGGARGLAHIGVIEAVESLGLEIQSVSGCSMGALVGGVYAMDQLEVYTDWVCALEKMDVLRLMDFAFGNNGLIKGDRIIGVLRELIGDAEIQDLPMAFTAVATDLDRQREVWISEGPLFDAIRASIAIPTIFTPHVIKGRMLVDGGLINPIPVAPTLRDHTDLTIVVNLGGSRDPALDSEPASEASPRKRDRLHPSIAAFIDSLEERFGSDGDSSDEDSLGLFDVVSRSFDAMQNHVARLKLAAYGPDVVIDIPRNACHTYQFYRARRVIELGRQCALEALADLDECQPRDSST
jgi:NTE family protein